MENSGLKRWESLDYLRGLMALAILVFHYEKWTTGVWNPATPQGKLGVYAVSAFFVISGMALTFTYESVFRARAGAWRSFAIKRFFRIYPLLWLATLLTLAFDGFQRPLPAVLLNLSGLFGLVNPAGDIATGAWSIGCELVYYCLFPLLLLIGIRRKRWLPVLSGLLISFSLIRGFFTPFYGQVLDQPIWWPVYVQAWMHACFFVAGMSLAFYRDRCWRITAVKWQWLALISALFFLLTPVSANSQELIGGFSKVALSLSILAFAAGWSYGTRHLPFLLHRILAWLGAVSYSLYLLHPLVYRAVKSAMIHAGYEGPAIAYPVAAAPIALIASHLCYYYFEKPLMKAAASKAASSGSGVKTT